MSEDTHTVDVTEDDFIPFDPPVDIIYAGVLAGGELTQRPPDDKYNPGQKELQLQFRFAHDPSLPDVVRKMVGGQLARARWALNSAQLDRFCRTFNLDKMSFARDIKTWANMPVRFRITKKEGNRKVKDENGNDVLEPTVFVNVDAVFKAES